MILDRISPATHALIDRILRDSFADWNFVGFEAEARPDGFGDPAIYITARFEPLEARPPIEASTRATVALLDGLRDTGDERLPFLYFVYPDAPESEEAA